MEFITCSGELTPGEALTSFTVCNAYCPPPRIRHWVLATACRPRNNRGLPMKPLTFQISYRYMHTTYRWLVNHSVSYRQKLPKKICSLISHVGMMLLQLLGVKSPDLLPGLCPEPHWGTCVGQAPWLGALLENSWMDPPSIINPSIVKSRVYACRLCTSN